MSVLNIGEGLISTRPNSYFWEIYKLSILSKQECDILGKCAKLDILLLAFYVFEYEAIYCIVWINGAHVRDGEQWNCCFWGWGPQSQKDR